MEIRLCMDATRQAWSIYLQGHAAVSAEDERRCSLERFVLERWYSGGKDLDELTCLGLAFLARTESIEDE